MLTTSYLHYMSHRIVFILLTALACCTAIPGHASPSPHKTSHIQEKILDNGLKIIVKEDHRAPLVASLIMYKVGGSFEPPGMTGISHALEHMMFKGTAKYPVGEFSRIISELGGDQNAFTSYDYTGYHEEIATSALPKVLELEADRMQNLHFSEEEFAKEIKVVMEERRLRTEDKPEMMTEERFRAGAFINNPYQHPIIGWMSDIQNLNPQDLKKWYETWYAPNNAVLIIVGDVQPEAVFNLANSYFGHIPKRDLPSVKPLREVPALGEKRIEVKLPAKVPHLYMGFQAPNLQDTKNLNEAYALIALLNLLDGGESSRFTEALIRKQIASSLYTGYDPFHLHTTLFTISAAPRA